MHDDIPTNTLRLERDELKYLLECSRASVASYRLIREAESANLRKQALDLMRASVEKKARALLAKWIEDVGEAIVCGDLFPADGPAHAAIAPACERRDPGRVDASQVTN